MEINFTHISTIKKSYQAIRDGSEETWGARLADMARKGAAMPGPDCGRMCSDCAFKHPQPGTQDYYNAVDGAVQILMMGGRFNCHTKEHEDAGRLCAGMEYAKRYDAKNQEDADS